MWFPFLVNYSAKLGWCLFICLIKSAFIYREEKSQLSALETNLLFIVCQNTPIEPPNQLPLSACQKLVLSNL